MKFCFFGAQAFSLILSLFVGAFPSAHAAPAQVSQDAFINAQRHRANSTLGSRTLIKVSAEYPRHGLLQFDLTGIEGNITSAILTFSVDRVLSSGNIGLHAVLNAWDESTVTFNSAPSFNPAPSTSVSVAPSDVDGLVSIDIASLAQIWVDNSANNHGLALVSQGANVELHSKEGGMGATLEVDTGGPNGASSNTVLVALDGGDYSNPADAADNAFEGDKWCDDLVPSTCEIIVGPGAYLVDRTLLLIHPEFDEISLVHSVIGLRGAGVDVTTMTFAPDVDVAVSGGGLRAVTVIHTEPLNTEKTGWLSFEDNAIQGNNVRILVEGGTVNYGVRGELHSDIALSDTSIRVSGGVRSAGIYGTSHVLKNVVVSANGEMATGVVNFDEDSLGLQMDGSDVTASGSSATAVSAAGAGATITDSRVASNGNAARGFAANLRDGSLRLSGSTVRGSGAGSIGLHIRDRNERYLVSRTDIFGETALLFDDFDGDAEFNHLEIAASTLTGTQTALALQNDRSGGGTVNIDNSTLNAPVAIEAQDRYVIAVGASKLGGVVHPGTSLFTCVYVYNAEYEALDEKCL